jgi:type IX secretion system PorP/SprF family membrane protein
MFNPAFCGTKRFVDFRMFYRNQWVGYTGAPTTYAASLNFRYFKGKLGTGAYVFRDEIGPFQTTNAALTFAYHIKFDDVELSVGLQGNYISQTFNGNKVTLHNQIDNSINLYTSANSYTFDGSAGFVLYNDRFYVGFGANNLIGSEMVYYKTDPNHKGRFKNEGTYALGVGYNYAENQDFIFENSLMAVYTPGIPFYLDYTLRLHIKNKVFGGFSFRPTDAFALLLGVTLKNSFQVAYSYDIITSPLSKYQSGSHEIKLIFSTNAGKDKKRHGFNNGTFIKQKFQYLL